jgi:hypothetical protein
MAALRTDFYRKRVELMQAWANYVTASRPVP